MKNKPRIKISIVGDGPDDAAAATTMMRVRQDGMGARYPPSSSMRPSSSSTRPSSSSSSSYMANFLGNALTRAAGRMHDAIEGVFHGDAPSWLPLCDDAAATATLSSHRAYTANPTPTYDVGDDDIGKGVANDATNVTVSTSTTIYDDTVSFDRPPLAATNDDDDDDVAADRVEEEDDVLVTSANDIEIVVPTSHPIPISPPAISNTAPPPSLAANFAIWLSSKEFDASAIVCNADVDDDDDDGGGDGGGGGRVVACEDHDGDDGGGNADTRTGGGCADHLPPHGRPSSYASRYVGMDKTIAVASMTNTLASPPPSVGGTADHRLGNDGGDGGGGGGGCSALDGLLPPMLGCALESVFRSNWKCWEVGGVGGGGDDDDAGIATMDDAAVVNAAASHPSRRIDAPSFSRAASDKECCRDASSTKVKKDSSWALDNLGISPVRDRAMFRSDWKCSEVGGFGGGGDNDDAGIVALDDAAMANAAVSHPSGVVAPMSHVASNEECRGTSSTKVKKDSSWALDNLGVSPVRDRAMFSSDWKCSEVGDGYNDGGGGIVTVDDAVLVAAHPSGVVAPMSHAASECHNTSSSRVMKDSSWTFDNLGFSPNGSPQENSNDNDTDFIKNARSFENEDGNVRRPVTSSDDVATERYGGMTRGFETSTIDAAHVIVVGMTKQITTTAATTDLSTVTTPFLGNDASVVPGRYPRDDGTTGSVETSTPNDEDAVGTTEQQPTTITRTWTNTDMSVATPLVGEDISVATGHYLQFAPWSHHPSEMNPDDRGTAHTSSQDPCTYSISPPRGDYVVYASNGGDVALMAVPAESETCDDDGKTPLMNDFLDRHRNAAGGYKISTKHYSPSDRKRWRMRRRSRLTTAS